MRGNSMTHFTCLRLFSNYQTETSNFNFIKLYTDKIDDICVTNMFVCLRRNVIIDTFIGYVYDREAVSFVFVENGYHGLH